MIIIIINAIARHIKCLFNVLNLLHPKTRWKTSYQLFVNHHSLIKLYGEDKSARLLRKQNHRLSIKASIINKDVKLKPNYDHKMYNFLNIQNKSIFEGTKNDFFKTHGFYASSDLFNGKRKHYRGWKLI
jgi:hypothetical protein